MTRTILLIFLGGGTGSLLRYGIQVWLRPHSMPAQFPWATLCVNIAGCFLIGLFYAWCARFNLSDETRLLLTTGLCGGFTTFSTFSYEGLGMLRQGCYATFFLYISVSLLAGIAAAFAGGWAGK